MPIHNDPENDNELINQSIPVTTIARLFKELSFKDPQTRITLSTLELSSEYIKLFINEAIIRANEERIDEGDTLVQIDGIDNVTSTAKNNQETQYPTIDEIEDSMRIDDDDDSNNINIGTVNEDDDDELIKMIDKNCRVEIRDQSTGDIILPDDSKLLEYVNKEKSILLILVNSNCL